MYNARARRARRNARKRYPPRFCVPRHACPAARSALLLRLLSSVRALLPASPPLYHARFPYRHKDIGPIITILSWFRAWHYISAGSAADTDRFGQHFITGRPADVKPRGRAFPRSNIYYLPSSLFFPTARAVKFLKIEEADEHCGNDPPEKPVLPLGHG